MALRVLAEVSPTFRIPPRLSPRFAKDLKIEQAEGDDGTRVAYFPRLTAVFALELLNAIERTVATFIAYHGSVLILCPENDAVCHYARLRKSVALHDAHNLKLVDLPGVGHSVFTEDPTARAAALDVIIPWLDSVLRPRPTSDVKISGASRDPRVRPLLDPDKPGASKT
jgi:alpha-beta hydrolase superfamily lysophospholipase